MRVRRRAILLFVLSAVLTGSVASHPAARGLTRQRRAQLLAALPEADRLWLTEYVAPIVLPEEEDLYLRIRHPAERESFREEFWRRREKPELSFPLGPGYRERYDRLRGLADEVYDGFREDAGRMVIYQGEPDSISDTRFCQWTGDSEPLNFFDQEIWTYDTGVPGHPGAKIFLFYRPIPTAARRLWDLTRGPSHFAPRANPRSLLQLGGRCRDAVKVGTAETPSMCACRLANAYREIAARQGEWGGGATETAALLSRPKLLTEDLSRIEERLLSLSDPDSKPVGVKDASMTSSTTATAARRRASPKRKLSPPEVQALRASLSAADREFLGLAEPLMSPAELEEFLQLEEPDRVLFIQKFWKSRS